MKKTYIIPATACFTLTTEMLLALSDTNVISYTGKDTPEGWSYDVTDISSGDDIGDEDAIGSSAKGGYELLW